LADLKTYHEVTKVCKIYASADRTGRGWRAYYSDVWRWRKADPDFDQAVRDNLPKRVWAGGRPRLDDGDKSWQEEYCRVYLERRGNLSEAAKVTPYSLRQIREFFDPGSSSYDKEFAEAVETLDLEIAGRLQEKFLELTEDDSLYENLDQAKIAQTRGWMLTKGLGALHPKWGKRTELNVKGTIQHDHRAILAKPREQLLADLADDRKRFFSALTTSRQALPSGERESIDLNSEPIEAEVIEIEAENAE